MLRSMASLKAKTMNKRADSNPCTTCNGTGLIRNDDPHSDRVYGDYCSDCNGTGLASDPEARRLAFWLFVVVNVLLTLIWLKACT